jgi:hypothetical protein
VFLLFGTKEDAVRAYFGLDGSVLGGGEVMRASWVNGERFESEYCDLGVVGGRADKGVGDAEKAEKDGEQADTGEMD